ncbi:MAG: YraN family protein [Acidobacteria bacterium]|nr:YraN family protein [Acidobacteriota bacterium]
MTAPHLLLGRRGERLACRFLARAGYDILARRYRARPGELDLIAFEGDTLVFVEVKTRSSRNYGEPWEYVDWEKRQALRRAAEDFISRFDLGRFDYRFDIVSVVGREVQLFRDAF